MEWVFQANRRFGTSLAEAVSNHVTLNRLDPGIGLTV
jgi:hypothetical protein